jgi:serpin B
MSASRSSKQFERNREERVSKRCGDAKRWLFTFVPLVFMVVLGCAKPGGAGKPGKLADDRDATSGGISKVVAANNEFACKLYAQLKDAPGNIFFSPFSISTALAMTYEGARGRTAEEMRSVLGFPDDSVMRRSAFARIYNRLNTRGTACEMNIANALWAQKGHQFLGSYLDVTSRYYSGQATDLNFRHATEESRRTIDQWVSDQTRGRIRDLLSDVAIDAWTRLILTNAVYFAGRWKLEFDKKDTKDADFRIGPNSCVKVPTMVQQSTFPYAEANGLRILELPYRTGSERAGRRTEELDSQPNPARPGELSMLVLLPRTDDLRSLEDSLANLNLTEWRRQLRNEDVKVFLPRFRIERRVILREALTALGMGSAFDMAVANFDGMRENDSLFIGDVVQKAVVETDEQGTVAAAATAEIIYDGEAPHFRFFRADHPFIFVIQERESGNILFIGRVVNPALGS